MFPSDLMELPFEKFDLILGVDSLVEHRVSLDCAIKRVTIRSEVNSKAVLIGKRRDYLSNIISSLVTDKLTRKGCEAYLAIITNTAPTKLTVSDIQTVRDFSDVFLDKIPGVEPT